MTRDPDTAKSINGHARDLNDTVKDNGSQCHRQVRGLNRKLADTTAEPLADGPGGIRQTIPGQGRP